MDERLKRAAETGNIDALYSSIHDDANVFKRIDKMEFVDTPLHVAAVTGNTGFAMEMMNLKPSFARKLNQDGFSPIHLALLSGKPEMVIDFLSIDENLVRLKGREGFTVAHYAARDVNVHLLSQFLDVCPDCIFDLTVRRQTALHIAAESNNFEAFKVMLEWIQKTFKDSRSTRIKILNLQDKDGNTVLHLAASNNQPQMMGMLVKCKGVDRKKINKLGFTAMDVLRRQTLADNRKCVKFLKSNPHRFSKFYNFDEILTDYFREMKLETINALLVVFSLVLSMTYQAILSPPGGFAEYAVASSNSNDRREGKSVMTSFHFLAFYVSNGVAFFISFAIMMSLFDVVAKNIMFCLWPLYLLMCNSYWFAFLTIAPSNSVINVVGLAVLIVPTLFFGISSFCFRKY
ncbi:serine/threonine-protein phosphatase 6 regulatory ankyrin repeat subunit B-like isoform X1 [Gossypium australe]|uniref:Serine/threonine-protein phosphatase 6 regulatory ankyrin repeat subunit B-like isoform X1 n=1 Tax=Gossypium australe TaxID=47621 RepID=A0A5B6U9V5_9ROSI|nr:serine/threonine-protein phosphatase 6 regulatory ankyrin repeat subunit B-like isoform X1 [Gossypium australe]